MKTRPPINTILRHRPFIIAGVLSAGLAAFSVLAGDNLPQGVTVISDRSSASGGGGDGVGMSAGTSGGGGGSQSSVEASPDYPAPPPGQSQMLFRAVMADDSAVKDSLWLGVAVTDTTEPLSAQLGLRRGEGLVVSLVSSNSPATVAGLQKNDVLVALDGQMLVDPGQLRKLVQMHADGDVVKLEYYRAGKKESVSAKLANQPADQALLDSNQYPIGRYSPRFNAFLDRADNAKVQAEVQHAIADAEHAMQGALRQSENETGSLNQRLQVLQKKLGHLANGGVDLDKNTTVVVKNDSDTVRTVVKKDETGTYILIADPARHLTVHDAGNKLLFDGPVDSPTQQRKVPSDLWKKVGPMLSQLDQDPTAPAPPAPPTPPEAPEPPQNK